MLPSISPPPPRRASPSFRAAVIEKIAGSFGVSILNAVPSIVHSLPFAPLNNILGPKGERWVPLHGILPHSRAGAMHQAAMQVFARHAEAMKRHSIQFGGMGTTLGTGAFLYELALYWHDQREIYHENMLDPAYLASLPSYASDPEGREKVMQIKAELTEEYHRQGAAHLQVGRSIPCSATAIRALSPCCGR